MLIRLLRHLHDMKQYAFTGNEADLISIHVEFIKEKRDKFIIRLYSIYKRNMINSDVNSILRNAKLEAYSVVFVTSADNEAIAYNAKILLIVVGGYSTFPEEEGFREYAIYSFYRFFELETSLKRAFMVDSGSRYIDVELAGALQDFGTDTSLFVRKDKSMRKFGTMLAKTLDEKMKRQGIQLHRNTNVI